MNESEIKIDQILSQEDDFILEGFLRCSNTQCHNIYPILEGIPIVIPEVAKWWSYEKYGFMKIPSRKMSSKMEGYLGGLDTQEPEVDATISQLSAYLTLHYESYNADNSVIDQLSTDTFWQTVIQIAQPYNDKPYQCSLDMGCSVGRYTFELSTFSELSIGMDLNFSMLQFAEHLQKVGKVKYKRKKNGIAFERSELTYEAPQKALFLLADAMSPPFRAGSFDCIAGLNLIDNVKIPLILIGQMDALLKIGGKLIISSPYDWKPEISEPEEWIGTKEEDSPDMIRRIISGENLMDMSLDYKIVNDYLNVPWLIKNHDRSFSLYLVHILAAEKN